MYTLSEYVTIDETLHKLKGRCGFRVYMSQKSGKYGLSFMVITDAQVRYVYKIIPYAGKPRNEEIQTRNSPTDIVNVLTVDLMGCGRNITLDRFYTGVELAENMYNNYNLAVVGTIMKTKKEKKKKETGDTFQRKSSP